MKRTITATALLALTVTAFAAPSRNTFLPTTSLTGVEIIRNSNFSFTVAISNNAKFNGRQVTDLGGFYLLDNNNDMAATGVKQGAYDFTANYKGNGGVAGFEAAGHTGIKPGQTQVFTFSTVTGGADALGLKLNLDNCKTVFVSTCDTQAVPEPASMAALGMGALAILKRRKMKSA